MVDWSAHPAIHLLAVVDSSAHPAIDLTAPAMETSQWSSWSIGHACPPHLVHACKDISVVRMPMPYRSAVFSSYYSPWRQSARLADCSACTTPLAMNPWLYAIGDYWPGSIPISTIIDDNLGITHGLMEQPLHRARRPALHISCQRIGRCLAFCPTSCTPRPGCRHCASVANKLIAWIGVIDLAAKVDEEGDRICLD